MWQIILLVGAMGGVGLAIVVAELLPRPPRLSAALERLGTTQTETADDDADLRTRLGLWAQKNLPPLPGMQIPARDLAVIGRTQVEHMSNRVILCGLGLILPTLVSVVTWLMGSPPPVLVPAIAGPALGLLLYWIADVQVRAQAKEAREEFSRAVAAYLELVAAERKRGAPTSQALEEAARIGQSWVFVRIRQELTRARYAGISPWTGLKSLAEELGVIELGEVADIMRLSGEQGASVYESLRARGRSMRTQLLNEEHTQANKVSEQMTIPMTCLGLILAAILLTPPLLQLITQN